ncbi:hypothetical protein BJX63DRAFT_418500 [Aspergillus granulosus]|uniref:Mid2 domain-containing protein n=1 Tax=Aspergillus granulosus TaxID=176169 RepID=A0ABR4HY44_9EURO
MLLFSIICILFLPSLSTAVCYYPSGNPATEDVQCTPGENSACCGHGAICLSNGYCLGIVQPFSLSRGSCTDPTFEIDECAKECLDIQRDSGCTIVPDNATEEGVTYCCNSIVNHPSDVNLACAWNADPITLASATIMPGVAILEDYTLKSDDNSSINTSASSEGGEEASTEHSSPNTVAIGAGVGVPLGIIALFGIAWALFERRKRKGLQNTQKMAIEANGCRLITVPLHIKLLTPRHNI